MGQSIASATVGGLKAKCALYVLKKQNHSWMEPLIYHTEKIEGKYNADKNEVRCPDWCGSVD